MKKLLIAGLFLMGVASCSVDNAVPENNDTDGIKTLDLVDNVDYVDYYGNVECGDKVTWPFGDLSVGKVEVYTVDQDLKVTITANNEVVTQRKLVESRVGFYATAAALPTATKVGQIPNRVVHTKGGAVVTSYTYSFPLMDFPRCGPFNVIVWANFAPEGSEAHHFAGDTRENHGNWKYFEYCATTCPDDDPPTNQVCTTAFMKTTTTLNSNYKTKPTNTNWGWYLNSDNWQIDFDNILQDPDPNAEELFPVYEIWAAAGQNITINRGEKVGEVTVYPDGTFYIYIPPIYTRIELHVYLNESLTLKRQAPGLYRTCGTLINLDNINSDCIVLDEDGIGDFSLIIHMKVCWNVPAN